MRKTKKWTPEEIDYMKKVYKKVGYKKAMSDLKRTKKSILRKAEELGVQVKKEFWRKHISENHQDVSGEKNPSWKGGQTIRKGYMYIYKPEHPFATKNGNVLRSRLVMEKYLGRFLKKNEVVHHRNKNTFDDRISNLALFINNAEHLKSELKGTKRG